MPCASRRCSSSLLGEGGKKKMQPAFTAWRVPRCGRYDQTELRMESKDGTLDGPQGYVSMQGRKVARWRPINAELLRANFWATHRSPHFHRGKYNSVHMCFAEPTQKDINNYGLSAVVFWGAYRSDRTLAFKSPLNTVQNDMEKTLIRSASFADARYCSPTASDFF